MADAPKVEYPKDQTGPIVKSTPGESLDVTEFANSNSVPLDGPTGDSPPKAGSVRLLDKEPADSAKGEGDSPRTSKDAALVEVAAERVITVGELRKAGYKVEGKDGDVALSYTADSPTPPNEVHLVEPPADGGQEVDAVAVDGADKPVEQPAKQVRSAPENKKK